MYLATKKLRLDRAVIKSSSHLQPKRVKIWQIGIKTDRLFEAFQVCYK